MSAHKPGVDLAEIIKSYDVRGVVPQQLNAEVAQAIGAAFATVVVIPDAGDRADQTPADIVAAGGRRPQVVVGRDMRESGPELVAAFARGLTAAGVDVLDIGLCSTDGLYHASGVWGIPGAMFTASHNPAQYNGMKLCRAGARPVGQDSGLGRIRELAQQYVAYGLPGEATQLGQVSRREMLGEYASFLRSLVDISGSAR